MSLKPIPALDPAATAENLDHLRTLLPSAFREGKIDFEVLRQLLGDTVDDRPERYGLNWNGKRAARQLALTPSAATLRPQPGDSVDWDTTQNLMIEGDNLEVLKLLQKPYAGQVKLIYIDPPYNTGKDFIYPDNFRDSITNYLQITGQVGEAGAKLTTNPEASGRFHTDWLNMIYPRLFLARNLLRDDGAIFVSIDDHEVANLRLLMDEIFGPENFVATIVWKKSYGGGAKVKQVVGLHEYILAYARSVDSLGALELPPDPNTRRYYKLQDAKYATRGPYRLQPLATTSNDERPNLRYPIQFDGSEIWPEKQWQWERSKTERAFENGELVIAKEAGGFTVNYKQYLRDENGKERGAKPFSVLNGPYTQAGTDELKELFSADKKVLPFPKPTSLLTHLFSYAREKNPLVLDFFAGSGTTGHAVMAQNAADGGHRRYVLVQLPEPTGRTDYPTIAEICRERLRRAGEKIRAEHPLFHGDLGFRAFRLDSSNIREWSPDPAQIDGALQQSIEHLKADRSEADILYEVLLRLNLDLCLPVVTRTIAGKAVYSVGAGTLFACLAPAIAQVDVEPLALGITAWRDELNPGGEPTAVFRDSAFADDVAKTNCVAILRQHAFPESNLRSI